MPELEQKETERWAEVIVQAVIAKLDSIIVDQKSSPSEPLVLYECESGNEAQHKALYKLYTHCVEREIVAWICQYRWIKDDGSSHEMTALKLRVPHGEEKK